MIEMDRPSRTMLAPHTASTYRAAELVRSFFRAALLLAVATASCKSSWFEETKKTETSSTSPAETFPMVDDSSALPTRGRPHATRKATVRVVMQDPPSKERRSLSLELQTTVERPNARIKLALTEPDGTVAEGRGTMASALFFCPAPPKPCEANYTVQMTYDGLPGTDRVTWKATAKAIAYGADGATMAPPALRPPIVTATLLPP